CDAQQDLRHAAAIKRRGVDEVQPAVQRHMHCAQGFADIDPAEFLPKNSAGSMSAKPCAQCMTSLTSTLRNSCPSDDAPKLMTDSLRAVFPKGRCSISPRSRKPS